MSIELITQILNAFILGIMVGAIYFIALWITVQRLVLTKTPIFLSVLSMYARITAVALALCLIMDGSVLRLATAISGFMIARAIAVKFVTPSENTTRA